MWQVFGNKITLTIGVVAVMTSISICAARSEESFQLPGVALSQGSDEVRAADGTSCRSSLGSDGAYVDMGMIGKKNQLNQNNDGSYYGRVVVPIGKASKRLDCSELYKLEVERLKLELELAKAGMGRQEDTSIDQTETSGVSTLKPFQSARTKQVEQQKMVKQSNENTKLDWMNEGWSTDGRQKSDSQF
jgi:hypothetical protein